MRPLFGARGLPQGTYASWRASLGRRPGATVRILAWARGETGFVVGSPAVLSLGDAADETGDALADDRAGEVASEGTGDGPGPDAGDGVDAGDVSSGTADSSLAVDDGWRHVGWHEIEHGGWNAESSSLSWTLYGGRRGRVGLAAPGRLPELFRERVAASIVVERFVPIRGERGVTVTARRDLSGSGGISWHSTLTRGLSWSTEGVAEEVARASAELQSEYGSASPGW